jgi:formate dehydrogenase iron-sulfur subunit
MENNTTANSEQAGMNRRNFLKVTGASLGGILLSTPDMALAAEERNLDDDVCVLYDATKCIGCKLCERACKEYNSLPEEVPPPQHLSAITWNMIFERNGVEKDDWPYWNKQCMHCTNAACVTVCPTGAMHYDEMGFVAVNEELCNGCGYCTQACPFGVPHLKDENVLTGWGKSAKCTFCQEKTRSGEGGPSCAEACPTGALVWGQRGELLAQAKARVTELEAEGREDVTLYGETEAGGLHRMSILPYDAAAYDLPADPHGPLSYAVIREVYVQALAGILLGVGALGAIGAFLVARRTIDMEEVE